MGEIETAVLRKLAFMILLLVGYLVVDRWILTGFRTPEVLRTDAKAIAHLLGMLALAFALA